MILTYFKPRSEDIIAIKFYSIIVKQSRLPILYQNSQIPDIMKNRFEFVCLHTSLILQALEKTSKDSLQVRQALIDLFVKDMDMNIRESGVGDTGIAKKVRKLAETLKIRHETYKNWSDYTQERKYKVLKDIFFEAKKEISQRILRLFSEYIIRSQHNFEKKPLELSNKTNKKGDPVFVEPPFL